MKIKLQTAEALVFGGAIMGGGGGGSYEEGLKLAQLALDLGSPQILSLREIDPQAWVITSSLVGAPAAKDKFVKPMDYVRSMAKVCGALDEQVGGIIQNEMGGLASANGLIQSAVLGLPIIDAPCNGRAHPIAAMGSLGLHARKGYHSVQAACGGDPDQGRRLELLVEGSLESCSALVRAASVQAGGFVAVARNPVQAAWLKDSAAVGGTRATISLGRVFLEALQSGSSPEEKVAAHLGGEVVARGKVARIDLKSEGGFDLGLVVLDSGHEMPFWNEYILIEAEGRRLYTFPDLIATFDLATFRPVSSAEIAEGMEVAVVAAKKDRLILGGGMRDRSLFLRVEEAVGRPVVPFVFGEA
ncbi:MAG: DUF917 family protein [Deltaproteobacteria bacterium]|nr:DUF917 family protein [Deltaproteobacteria bacterium]